MTGERDPAALRRASDADLHPMLAEERRDRSTSGAVVRGPLTSASTARDEAPASTRDAVQPSGEADRTSVKARAGARETKAGRAKKTAKTTKAKKATKSQAAARAKRVDLKVSVPKPLRTRVRDIARARGIEPDDVVTEILRAALDER